jgi:peptidase E
MFGRTIIAIGGFPTASLVDYALGFAEGRRVLVDTTASPDGEFERPEEWDAELTPMSFYPWPPEDIRELALSHDAILVCGGNTANMLAVWRVHGFDRILREAWESGIVLSGNSAGMICWFEAAVTDSFGPSLATMSDGLGFLPGSACPHYDDEELRRPLYRRAVDDGFPPGYAADSGVGLHFVSTELAEVITSREGATGYRVEPGVETPLPARLVG